MKRLLLVYPNNFLQSASGIDNRVKQLVLMFQQIGFCIDQFAYEDFTDQSSFLNFAKMNKEHMIHHLYLYNIRLACREGQCKKRGFYSNIKEKIYDGLCTHIKKEYLFDWTSTGAKKYFKEIVDQQQYDVIVVFYTYLATLLKGVHTTAKKIYFMDDSYFIQQYALCKQDKKGYTIGRLLDEEIKRLRMFDDIFCISYDEKIFYEKVTGKSIYFLPHLQSKRCTKTNTLVKEKKWDVLFIGSDNSFNIEGISWFLKNVYPRLNKNLKILLVGSVVQHIYCKYENVDKILYVDNLDHVYEQVKVTICPMFRGTGMKIKVVESMAKNIPVVCNERGMDGFPDKTLTGCLVTQDAKQFAGYINRLCEDDSYYEKKREQIAAYYQNIFCIEKYKRLIDKILCS